MADLTEHITDSKHNWIIPTFDTNNTVLSDFYVSSVGYLNWPTGYIASGDGYGYLASNFIQLNWMPTTDTWFIEFDISFNITYPLVAGQAYCFCLYIKEEEDTTLYGPQLTMGTDDYDYYQYIYTYDGSQYNDYDYINFYINSDRTYTYRVEIVKNNVFRVFRKALTDADFILIAHSRFVPHNNNPNLDYYYPSLKRVAFGISTGEHNPPEIKLGRVRCCDYEDDLNKCEDVGATNYFVDEFLGSGYITSRNISSTDNDSWQYVSSASAEIIDGVVTPAIFVLNPTSSYEYFECFFIKLNLGTTDTATIEIIDQYYSSIYSRFILSFNWGSTEDCSATVLDNNYGGSSYQTFSIGTYQNSGNLEIFMVCNNSGNPSYLDQYEIYIGPEYSQPKIVVTEVPNEIILENAFYAGYIKIYGENSTVDYIRMCRGGGE